MLFRAFYALPDSIVGPDGKPVPGIAPAAKQQGRYVADAIKARLRGGTPALFRYQHAGSLAQIGKRKAVIDFGRIKLRGTLAWWIWGIAHIYFLIGFRNRLVVAMNWLWNYVTFQRGTRLITGLTGARMEDMPMPDEKQPPLRGAA